MSLRRGESFPQQRWRFVRDDDGHSYLIPAEAAQQFYAWVDHMYESSIPYEGIDFNDCRINGCTSLYSFTDPKEN